MAQREEKVAVLWVRDRKKKNCGPLRGIRMSPVVERQEEKLAPWLIEMNKKERCAMETGIRSCTVAQKQKNKKEHYGSVREIRGRTEAQEKD